jgi:hypothetical protein
MRRIALTISSLLLPALVLSQDILLDSDMQSEEEAEVRRYTTEIIVFRYAEDVSVGTEVFIPKVIEIVPELQLDEEIADTPAESPVDDARTINRFEIQMLAEEDLELTGTFDRLDRLDAYEPLMHVGWTQTALPETETPALDLRQFGTPPVGLNGAFTLYLSRFLHLVVDLELDAPGADRTFGRAAPVFDQPAPRFDDARSARNSEAAYLYDEPSYEPLRYRIDENRLFKNGETRYFDHPKFGVIAKIFRFEEPEPEDVPDDTDFLSPAVVSD